MRTAKHDGTKLAYLDTGVGDPPFVFVHGWSCNHSHFAPQIEHFATGHRVLALDLRGHGASDAPEQRYTVQAFADDVLRALNPRIRTGQTVGAGHFNQLEVPQQVNAMIERFLAVALH